MKRVWITPSEIDPYIPEHITTIYNWCSDGTIRGARKIGKRWQIPLDEAVRIIGHNPFEAKEAKTEKGQPGATPLKNAALAA